MTAINLFDPRHPGAKKVKKVSVGIASDNPDVALPASDVGAAVAIATPFVGCVIKEVTFNKRTAFGSTGSPTMTVGDTDADGIILSTVLVASDAGIKSMAQVGGAYIGGRVYTSDDTLSIGVTVGTAPVNAGLMDVIFEYYDINELSK
jgi:hypothetical protein